MKRCIVAITLLALTSSLIAEDTSNDLSAYLTNNEELYRTGAGSEDGIFAASATSMLGWGVGLALGIGILASVLHQSDASHAHSTTTSSSQ